MLLFGLLLLLGAVSRGYGAAPVWVTDLGSSVFYENATIGDYIGTLNATDADGGTITYSIVDLADSFIGPYERDGFDYLDVEPSRGDVTVSVEVDFEEFTLLRVQWMAESGGVTTSSSIESFYIINTNDNRPVFTNEIPYATTIDEDTPVNEIIYTAKADDADGDAVIYELLTGLGCETEAFRLDSSTGEVKVNTALNYAEVVQYTVCIGAQDDAASGSPPLNSTLNLILAVSIRDVQNLPPVFEGQPYDKAIPEDVPIGSSVLQVFARDGDRGVMTQNTIIYSLVDNENDTFEIDQDGNIQNMKALDRDTDPITQLYTLVVEAKEDDSAQSDNKIITFANVYLRLTDVDDNKPTFEPSDDVFGSIPENSPKGTPINFNLNVYDRDSIESGEIKLSLEDDGGVFRLQGETVFNEGTVDVRVENSSALDFETIKELHFQIKAENARNSTNFSMVSATVFLTDTNDNTPEFTQEQYDVLLPEDSANGDFVIQILASDRDVNSILYYGIAGQNDGWYNVDRETGNITVSGEADFDAELLSIYFLTCQVNDGERLSTALLNITIVDVNDNDPKFQMTTYSISIPEYNDTHVGDSFIQVMATDSDLGSSNNQLTYTIVTGNGAGKFDIKPDTGWIFRNASIDKETETSAYSLGVMATDSGAPPRNGTSTVEIMISDVNDNDPIFESDIYTASIKENAAPQTSVVVVTANDTDVGNNGAIYAIEDASIFIINAKGIISLSGALDHEGTPFYNLTVTATDRDSPFGVARCHVEITVDDVNDHPPVFASNLTREISVSEDEPISTEVIRLLVNDPDTDSHLFFEIKSVDAFDENNRRVEGDFTTQFEVDIATGNVYLEEELDREEVQRYDVTVEVRDLNASDGIQVDTADLVITVLDVNDNAPKFTNDLTNFSVVETEQVGMVISVDIKASDPDAADNGLVAYGLLDDAGGKVQIDNVTGILSVADGIDREMNATLSVTIRAYDLGDPMLYTDETRVIVIEDVNDNTPIFNTTLPSTFEIAENSEEGTFVMEVHATDQDATADYGTITYAISAGNGDEMFNIGQGTGNVTVAGLIDRESRATYTLTVVASDGERQDTLEVTIDIVDENDEAPEFTASFPEVVAISEATNMGTVIATIAAEDLDEPRTNNSEVRYTLTNNTDQFQVDVVTGSVSVNTNDLMQGSFSICFVASDLGDPSLSSEPGCFSVVVTDFNDKDPVFISPTEGERVFVEEDYRGSVVTAEALDGDSGINANITYSFDTSLGSNDYRHFTLDKRSGEINIETLTDREKQEVYILTVQATNLYAEPIRSSDVTFEVVVNDKDDNKPLYWGEGTLYPEPPEPTIRVIQEENATFAVDVPKAEDKDGPEFNKIYYFIIAGNEKGYFSLDKTTGNLSLTQAIDREAYSQFELVIRADSDSEFVTPGTDPDPLTNEQLARVTITVNDINDNGPVFPERQYYSGVLYSTLFGEVVTKVTAVDADEGTNAETSYQIDSQQAYNEDGILSGNNFEGFNINNEGEVIASVSFSGAGAVDTSYYIVSITASDILNTSYNNSTLLKLYYLTELDQLNVVFEDDTENVIEQQDDFAKLMETIIEDSGYADVAVNIDDVDFYMDDNNEPIAIPTVTSQVRRSTRRTSEAAYYTLMKLHVVNSISNEVILPRDIQYIVDHTNYTEQLDKYKVIAITYEVKPPERDPLTKAMKSSFGIAGIMLLVLILVLIIYFCRIDGLKRQIRVLDAGRIVRKDDDYVAPGTNKFAEEKNPIYNKEIFETAYDEVGSGDKVDVSGAKADDGDSDTSSASEVQEAAIDFLKEDDEDPLYEHVSDRGNQLLSQLLDVVEEGQGGITNPAMHPDFYVTDV